jgi:hypothetical protein
VTHYHIVSELSNILGEKYCGAFKKQNSIMPLLLGSRSDATVSSVSNGEEEEKFEEEEEEQDESAVEARKLRPGSAMMVVSTVSRTLYGSAVTIIYMKSK